MTAISISLKLPYNLWHFCFQLPAGNTHSHMLQAFKFTKYVTDPSIAPSLYITEASDLFVFLLLRPQSNRLVTSEPYSILCKYWVSLQKIWNVFPLQGSSILAWTVSIQLSPVCLFSTQLVEFSFLKYILSYYSYVQNLLCLISVYRIWQWPSFRAFSLISHRSSYPMSSLISEYSEFP